MKVLLLSVFFILQTNNVFAYNLYQKSKYDFNTTVSNVENFIKSHNLNIIYTIDHSKAAQSANLMMPPAEVIIFGNPSVGTSIMQDNPMWSTFLPLKVAIYQDAKGDTWISVPDLKQAQKRAKLALKSNKMKVKKMEQLLESLLKI